jgi:hypothetical protein
MPRTQRPLVALAIVALISAGCASTSASDTGTASSGANQTTSNHAKAVRFAECMRTHGVSAFPDPDASGDLTIDAVANGSSLDPNSGAFKNAIAACKDLEPPGFTGHKRTAQEQKSALKFAQCMRTHGVRDFPDPTPNGALIDTNRIPSAAGRGALSIPGFQAAADKCTGIYSGQLGLRVQ